MSEATPAVVLAGGKPVTTPDGRTTPRALVEVHGRPMVERVADALREARSVGDVLIVGDIPPVSGCLRAADRGGFVENILAGIEAFPNAGHVLLATCDTPFLTPASVDDFAERALALDADMVYPFVPVRLCYERFPGIKRTSLRLREGAMTGGNLVLARPAFLIQQRERTAEAYAARKSPFRLARMIGPGMTLRLAIGVTIWPSLVGVPELERAISNLLGGRARGVCSAYPELATDVDRPEELAALGGATS
jgi:molybdopterin-guanine dinucleotide biosynthesis protein A